MNFKICALALAAAAVASGTAQAAVDNVTTGNSSLLFVAIDNDANIQVTIDLGINVNDFVTSETFTSGLTSPVSWNFATNSTSLSTTGNDWSAAYDLFKATQTDGNFQWAVIGGDNISGGVAPTNNRSLYATGTPTRDNMLAFTTAAPVSNGLGAMQNYVAAAVASGGTLTTANNGAATQTASNGVGYFADPAGMGANFNGWLTWGYLMSNGQTSPFTRVHQFTNPLVFQFGNPTTQDDLSPAPIGFTFDIATNTLTLAPVPEPSTYAMLLAGLAAVGFMARRRKA
jgi:hypothetical protein